MRRIRAVIFDLDNVLYAEEDYLHCAYLDMACFLSSKCRFSADEIYDRLMAGWREKTSMYPRLFNDLIAGHWARTGTCSRIVENLLLCCSEFVTFSQCGGTCYRVEASWDQGGFAHEWECGSSEEQGSVARR